MTSANDNHSRRGSLLSDLLFLALAAPAYVLLVFRVAA